MYCPFLRATCLLFLLLQNYLSFYGFLKPNIWLCLNIINVSFWAHIIKYVPYSNSFDSCRVVIWTLLPLVCLGFVFQLRICWVIILRDLMCFNVFIVYYHLCMTAYNICMLCILVVLFKCVILVSRGCCLVVSICNTVVYTVLVFV